MRSARWWCRVSWSLCLAGGGAIAPAADEKAGDPALTRKGLTKQGATYVLVDGERPVLAKLREARGALKDMAAAGDERARNQQLAAHADDLEQQRSMLQLQMDGLTQQIALQPTGPSQGGGGGMGGGPGGSGGFGRGGGMGGGSAAGSAAGGSFGPGGQGSGSSALMIQREQVRQQLLLVMNEQRAVKGQSSPAKEDTSLDKRAQKAEDRFRATLADLRKQVDEVRKKYADLEADDEVKGALALARKGNGRIRLGPSEAFVAATRELDKAERQFLDKKPTTSAAKKKGSAKAKR